MKAIIIYATDPWHSLKSRELIAVATTEKKRDAIVRKFLREYLEERPSREETAEFVRQVGEIGQTQGLSVRYDMEIDTVTVKANQISY